MNASEAYTARRSVFEAELAGLIAGAATTATSPLRPASPTEASAHLPLDSESEDTEISAAPGRSSPRASSRSTGTSADDNTSIAPNTGRQQLYVHPARRVLLTGTISSKSSSISPDEAVTERALPPLSLATARLIPRGPARKSSNGDKHQSPVWVNRPQIKRQWDEGEDIPYEALLEMRRNENVDGVDRYVPEPGHSRPTKRPPPTSGDLQGTTFEQLRPQKRQRLNGAAARAPTASSRGRESELRPKITKRRKPTSFSFEKLPESVQNRVLALLLVSRRPIQIDFTWLRPFIQGHARVPASHKTIQYEGVQYEIPQSMNKIVAEVGMMQQDLETFKSALEGRAYRSRKHRAPCSGMTTSLLLVSRNVHEQAARTLYGQNTFSFPWSSTAWMQLESFLATIGPTNTGYLRKLSIHVPIWYNGVQHDFIEGALLDLTSPVSRLAIIKPPAHDRLLSAIEHCVSALMQTSPANLATYNAPSLQSLPLSQLTHLELVGLETVQWAEYWVGHYRDDARLIPMADADEHSLRRQNGVAALKRLSDAMNNKPVLRLVNGSSRFADQDSAAYKRVVPALQQEADKYGWELGGGSA